MNARKIKKKTNSKNLEHGKMGKPYRSDLIPSRLKYNL